MCPHLSPEQAQNNLGQIALKKSTTSHLFGLILLKVCQKTGKNVK